MTKEKVIELLDSWYKHDEHTERVADEILALFGVMQRSELLNCPVCKRETKITNNAKTMARCFYCGNKWTI